ncbi:2-ketoglutarate ferredoxin oxidoreductase subunit delta [Archaeoglobales archaeon]|nr:MAG: 2-ketoglutarate ferredoxin oxidoreductase subunit delta [Archaeoglobales archaeon]
MAEIKIDEKLCKKCGICIEVCPQKIITLNSSLIVTENCKGCRLCEYHCPDFAIEVITNNKQ